MPQHIISSSLFILAFIIIRAAFKGKIKRNIIYLMWILVFLRLVIPLTLFQITVPATVQPQTPPVTVSAPAAENSVPVREERSRAEVSAGTHQTVSVTEPAVSIVPAADTQKALTAEEILTALWIFGSVSVALWFTFVSVRFGVKVLKDRKHFRTDGKTKIYISNSVKSPCSFGLVPCVVITAETVSSPELELIISHEKTHIAHFDNIRATLRRLAVALYWWNPLVWVYFTLASRDAELACDESVTNDFDFDKKLRYAKTILAFSPGNAYAQGFGSKPIKERMNALTNPIKKSAAALVLSLVLLICAAGCSTGDIKEESGSDDSSQTASEVSDTSSAVSDTSSAVSEESGGENKLKVEEDGVQYIAKMQYADGSEAEILKAAFIPFCELSPDGKTVVLDDFELESESNVYIFDVDGRETKKLDLSTLPEDNTASFVSWLNNDIFMFVSQLDHGSVVVGGELYYYNIRTDKYAKLISTDDSHLQINGFETNGDTVTVKAELYDSTWNETTPKTYAFTISELLSLIESNKSTSVASGLAAETTEENYYLDGAFKEVKVTDGYGYSESRLYFGDKFLYYLFDGTEVKEISGSIADNCVIVKLLSSGEKISFMGETGGSKIIDTDMTCFIIDKDGNELVPAGAYCLMDYNGGYIAATVGINSEEYIIDREGNKLTDKMKSVVACYKNNALFHVTDTKGRAYCLVVGSGGALTETEYVSGESLSEYNDAIMPEVSAFFNAVKTKDRDGIVKAVGEDVYNAALEETLEDGYNPGEDRTNPAKRLAWFLKNSDRLSFPSSIRYAYCECVHTEKGLITEFSYDEDFDLGDEWCYLSVYVESDGNGGFKLVKVYI